MRDGRGLVLIKLWDRGKRKDVIVRTGGLKRKIRTEWPSRYKADILMTTVWLPA